MSENRPKLTREKIYIETSVISYYTGKMTKDLIITGRQQITKTWWIKILPKYQSYISPYVMDEIEKGNKEFAAKRIEAVKNMDYIAATPEMVNLSDEYFEKLSIPEKSRYDCLHLACGVISGMDIIVSWNMKHIVNPSTRRIVREVNERHQFMTPEIATPDEMMGVE